MNRVLIISAGIIHPSWLARIYFSRIAKSVEKINPVFSTSVEDLKLLGPQEFSAAVLYFHRSRISDDALRCLDRFVSQGGGLLAVHSASASFKQSRGYFNIIGGRFTSHGKVEDYAVSPRTESSIIFPGINDFTIRDELYIHEYRKDVTIHFYADYHGTPEPAVWTRVHHEGRVAYASFGHCARAMTVPEVKSIIQKCLLWVLHTKQETSA